MVSPTVQQKRKNKRGKNSLNHPQKSLHQTLSTKYLTAHAHHTEQNETTEK